jgi:hypothetical protein
MIFYSGVLWIEMEQCCCVFYFDSLDERKEIRDQVFS